MPLFFGLLDFGVGRSTVTLLETVRELKDPGIGVWFEEQNYGAPAGDGELTMTEESLSVSGNIKRRKRNDMKSCKSKPIACYGVRVENGSLVISPNNSAFSQAAGIHPKRHFV